MLKSVNVSFLYHYKINKKSVLIYMIRKAKKKEKQRKKAKKK